MGLTSHMTPTVREMFTFALRSLFGHSTFFVALLHVVQEEFQIKLSRKIVLCQICIGHRSARFRCYMHVYVASYSLTAL